MDQVHISKTRGGTACGKSGESVSDVNFATCPECLRIADADMPDDQETETLVLFRRFKRKDGGDVVALFPLLPETDPGTCSSYQHIGQHGAASLRLMLDTIPARMDELDVAELARELASIGYRLRPTKRLPNWRRIMESRREAGLR